MKITAEQYKQARCALGLTNIQLSKLLGVYLRTAQRYESGETPVRGPVARLLFMYWKHGIPDELQISNLKQGSGQGNMKSDQ